MYKLLKTRSSGYIPEAHNVRLRTQSGAWNNISKVGVISPTPYSSYTEPMSEDMMVNFLFSGIVNDTFVISAQQSAGTDWAAVPYQIYTGNNVETTTGITNITGTATLTIKGPNQTISPHWQYLRRVEFPEPVTGSAEAKINWGNNATVKVNTVADNVYWIAEDATAHTPPYITAFTQEELDNLYTYGLDFPNGSDSNNILMQYNTMPQSFTVNLKPTNTAKNNTELDYKLYTGNDSEIYHGEIHYSRVDANWGNWSAFTTDYYDDPPSPSAYGLYKASGWPMPEPPPDLGEIQIGNQIWASKNMAVSDGGEDIKVMNPMDSSALYYTAAKNLSSQYSTEYYYTLDAAKRVAAAKYPGWHVPTMEDWNTLMEYFFDNSGAAGGAAGKYLRAPTGSNGWIIGQGNNAANFSAIPNDALWRDRNTGNYLDPWYVGARALFWADETPSWSDGISGIFMMAYNNNAYPTTGAQLSPIYSSDAYQLQRNMLNVRLIKDS